MRPNRSCFFFWIVTFVGWAVAGEVYVEAEIRLQMQLPMSSYEDDVYVTCYNKPVRRCTIGPVRVLDKYTNITVDREKCEVLAKTSPGNRIISLNSNTDYLKMYNGNSSVGSALPPHFYFTYFNSRLSHGNQLFIKGENSTPYVWSVGLLSTEGWDCGYNFKVEDDIRFELKENKCILFAETLPTNTIVAVSRSGLTFSRYCIFYEKCPVILGYDGNSTDSEPYLILANSSFATRGNTIIIKCVHDCEHLSITLHRIASKEILAVNLQSSGFIKSPRYPLIDGESPYNLQVTWVLISVHRATLTLTLLELSLTESPETCLDIVQIESSDGFTKGICGDLGEPMEHQFTTDEITIRYIKNSGFPSNGFIFHYKACYEKLNYTLGFITVPANNGIVRCVFKIEVDTGENIILNIKGIGIHETSNGDCLNRIEIYDGTMPSTELLRICSSIDKPSEIASTSQVLYIVYSGYGDSEKNTTIAQYSYKADEEKIPFTETMPTTKIVIANLGVIVFLLTVNIIVCIWMKRQRNNMSRPSQTHRDVVIDNSATYYMEEQRTGNPYDECE